MAYIGKEPVVGNFQVCDSISVVNGQAAYTLQVSSTNVVPESSQHCLVSLNGILQAPVTSFTVSGSTLTFASNLATNDVIDFVILLGNVLDLGVPSDGVITNAKLSGDLISGETDIGGAIADADLFLVDDGAGGTLRKTAASRIKTYIGGGITEFDMWRITTTFADSAVPITSNWERVDTTFDKIGTGMTESSGVFSFPSTGKYLITFKFTAKNTNSTGERNFTGDIYSTTDNSSYTLVASGSCNIGYYGSSVNNWQSAIATLMFDVTNTTNDKVRFAVTPNGNGSNVSTIGSTTQNYTYVQFMKLGDT
tara:strand:- start:1588 stop:2514 length:927 start_codon:yes stop_codon:yes gene_type:complete